ncbi:hypothetical protein RUND412_008672 [Rhizina undulata]
MADFNFKGDFKAQDIVFALNGNSKYIINATLERSDGSPNPMASIVLDNFIGNEDGRFSWGGVNFSVTAKDVQLSINSSGVPSLEALLQSADGEWRQAEIGLSERIKNKDGEFVYE